MYACMHVFVCGCKLLHPPPRGTHLIAISPIPSQSISKLRQLRCRADRQLHHFLSVHLDAMQVSESASWGAQFYLAIIHAALERVGAPKDLVQIVTG